MRLATPAVRAQPCPANSVGTGNGQTCVCVDGYTGVLADAGNPASGAQSLVYDGPNSIALAVAAGCILGAFAIALSWQMTRTVPGVRMLSERVSMLLAGQTGRDAVLLAMFSSVGEEFLFRGCIQSEFGFWPATVLFAIVHVGRERVWLWWTASAFIAGIGLGILYEQYGGLLAPILMHFMINAINLRWLARRSVELGAIG